MFVIVTSACFRILYLLLSADSFCQVWQPICANKVVRPRYPDVRLGLEFSDDVCWYGEQIISFIIKTTASVTSDRFQPFWLFVT